MPSPTPDPDRRGGAMPGATDDDRALGALGAAAAVVVIPVKAFTAAKVRLAGVLDAPTRAELARSMADAVVRASSPLPVVVVCDDHDVAAWARSAGAVVVWTEGLGLNGAVDEGVRRLAALGVRRAVVAHGDLPFATGLADLAVATADEVVVVPDRRHDGTNVASVPTDRAFRFRYGPGSFAAHRAEAERRGLVVRVVDSERLGWDVDEPSDLAPPARLGAVPVRGTGGSAGPARADGAGA